MVDIGKLRSLSRDYIAGLPSKEAVGALEAWAAEYDPELHGVLGTHHELALEIFEIARRGTGSPRKDLASWQEFREHYGFCFPELHIPLTRLDDERFGDVDPELAAALAADLSRSYQHSGAGRRLVPAPARTGGAASPRAGHPDVPRRSAPVRRVDAGSRPCAAGLPHRTQP